MMCFLSFDVKDIELELKDNVLHDKTAEYTNIKVSEKINLGKAIILCRIMCKTLLPTGL